LHFYFTAFWSFKTAAYIFFFHNNLNQICIYVIMYYRLNFDVLCSILPFIDLALRSLIYTPVAPEAHVFHSSDIGSWVSPGRTLL
jgi:hypothetical protein